MSDLSNQTRELLRNAEGGDEPTGDDRERNRAALALKLAAGVGAGAAASAAKTAHAATVAGRTGMAAKVALVAVLVGGGIGLGLAWRAMHPGAPHASATARAPEAAPPVTSLARAALDLDSHIRDGGPAAPSVPVPPPAPAADLPAAAPARAAGPRPGARATSAPAAASATRAATLERETAALLQVRRDLREHDADAALAALAAYAHEFPDGLLGEEADALRVEALCALNRPDDAARAASSFLSRYPHSLHAARVERGCEGDASP